MSKSKSHNCTHPTTAMRTIDGGIQCVKCSAKRPTIKSEPPVIMEGSPSGS